MAVKIIILSTIVAAMALENPYCQLPCDFYDGVKHTNTVCQRKSVKCGPGPKCGNNSTTLKLTDDMRKLILDVHNAYRNNVAIGNEKRGSQPPASNMKTLSYDMELEFMAQCWTNECLGNPLIHDTCRRTKKYEFVGQNLGMQGHTKPNYFGTIDINGAIIQIITDWYNEVALFKKEKLYRFDAKLGHYTQLVWADTTHIGCAGTFYKEGKWNRFVFGCNYGPSGNIIGTPMYEEGNPCSKCSEQCDVSTFNGLCGKIKDTEEFKPYFYV